MCTYLSNASVLTFVNTVQLHAFALWKLLPLRLLKPILYIYSTPLQWCYACINSKQGMKFWCIYKFIIYADRLHYCFCHIWNSNATPAPEFFFLSLVQSPNKERLREIVRERERDNKEETSRWRDRQREKERDRGRGGKREIGREWEREKKDRKCKALLGSNKKGWDESLCVKLLHVRCTSHLERPFPYLFHSFYLSLSKLSIFFSLYQFLPLH